MILPGFNVIGIRYELSKSLSNNVKLAQNHWKIFNSKLRNNKLYLGSNWCKYAFIEKIENKIFYYISIPKKDFVPNDFTEKIILKSKYLRVEHIGNMNKLKDTINYVYKEIIPKNNDTITSFVMKASVIVKTGGIRPQIPKCAIIV